MPLDAARWQIEIGAADRTAQAFSSVERRLKSLAASQAQLGAQMNIGARAGAAGVNLLGAAFSRLLPALSAAAAATYAWNVGMRAGELKSQAEQIGLTTDQLQAYRLVAAQSGVSTEQLDAAMISLTRQMGAAAAGNDEAIAKFDRLGVKLIDSTGKLRSAADVTPELSRGLLQLGSETERNALTMDFFGKSGSRMVTVLGEISRGNSAVVDSARQQNALIGGETIKVWDDLASQLAVSHQRLEALLATAGKPIAEGFLFVLNRQLNIMNNALLVARGGINWIARNIGVSDGTTSSEDLIKRREAMEAWIEVNRESTDALDVAKLKDYRSQIAGINNELASRAKVVTLEPITVTAGASQPPGKSAGAAAQKLDDRLRELVDERQALERALAAFDVKGTQTVDEIDRKLNAQVALDKKIFDVLKDVPPNSPLAQQLTQEAVAISQLNQKLDERKKLLGDAERVTAQFGNGQAEFARQSEQLGKMLAAGAINVATYERAMKQLRDTTDDQARAARGAAGGVDAFIAGIEQGMADMARANTEFEIGRRSIDALGESIDVLAGISNKTFGQIAADFALMIAKMEAQRAASEAWKAIGGSDMIKSAGGWLAGLFGAGSGGGGSAGGNVAGSGMGGDFPSPYADGGDYAAGQARVVGENGWELDIPRRPGTIMNQRQLAEAMGGGGGGVNIYQTMYFGSDVNQATLRAWGEQVKQSTVAEIVDRRRRGGDVKTAFAGK